MTLGGTPLPRLPLWRAEAQHEPGAAIVLWKLQTGGRVHARWDPCAKAWRLDARWRHTDRVLGVRLQSLAVFDRCLEGAFRKLTHDLHQIQREGI